MTLMQMELLSSPPGPPPRLTEPVRAHRDTAPAASRRDYPGSCAVSSYGTESEKSSHGNVSHASSPTNVFPEPIGNDLGDQVRFVLQAAWREQWLSGNVRQLCEGGFQSRPMYFVTVAWPTSIPGLTSSPWMRGAPQSGFACAIWQIRSRIAGAILGLPGLPRRLLHRQ
jgi:hypothetical protein